MKSNKNIAISLLVVMTISLTGIFFSSCNKYEEGPAFSLTSATKRITGTWDVKETLVDGQVIDINNMLGMLGEMDLDSVDMGFDFDLGDISVNSITVTFEKGGTGNFTINFSMMGFPYPYPQTMTWAFDDKKENVNITFEDEVETFKILKLTKDELWLENSTTIDETTSVSLMKLEKQD